MLELTIKAESVEDLMKQLKSMALAMDEPPLAEVPKIALIKEEVLEQKLPNFDKPMRVEIPDAEPIIGGEQLQMNLDTAPEHKEPEQPTIEEVRAAMRDLRDRKGAAAVRELLKAYGVDSLTDLKPEDYLGALARAKTEV